MRHFADEHVGKMRFGFRMGKLKPLLLRLLYKVEGLPAGADTDEDSNFLRFFQRFVECVETAGVKITDESIKNSVSLINCNSSDPI